MYLKEVLHLAARIVNDRKQRSADICVLPIYRYRPKYPILSTSVAVDKTLLYSSHIQTTCAREHNQASQQLSDSSAGRCGFYKPTGKINHGACVCHRSRNKRIIGKFRNAWRYRVQELCTNKLPLHFRKFSQHEKFDCNLRCRSSINA